MVGLKQVIRASLLTLSALNAQQNERGDMTKTVTTENGLLKAVLQGRLDAFRSGMGSLRKN